MFVFTVSIMTSSSSGSCQLSNHRTAKKNLGRRKMKTKQVPVKAKLQELRHKCRSAIS